MHAEVQKITDCVKAFDDLWEMESKILKEYIEPRKHAPRSTALLPSSALHLLTTYFGEQDDPIQDDFPLAKIELHPGLIPKEGSESAHDDDEEDPQRQLFGGEEEWEVDMDAGVVMA